MKTPRSWPGSTRMLVEVVLVAVTVSLVYWALGLHDTPVEPESPETDGQSIDDFFQVFGSVVTFIAAVVLVAGFELTLLIIRARRQACDQAEF